MTLHSCRAVELLINSNVIVTTHTCLQSRLKSKHILISSNVIYNVHKLVLAWEICECLIRYCNTVIDSQWPGVNVYPVITPAPLTESVIILKCTCHIIFHLSNPILPICLIDPRSPPPKQPLTLCDSPIVAALCGIKSHTRFSLSFTLIFISKMFFFQNLGGLLGIYAIKYIVA